MPDAVEAAVGTVPSTQYCQALEGGALGWADVVVGSAEHQTGRRAVPGGDGHHGGQDERQTVGHVLVRGAGQRRSVP